MRFFDRLKLAAAIRGNNIGRVRELLDEGIDPNLDFGGGETPLHLAADQRASREIIALLVERGAKVNALKQYQWAPIHDAAYRGNFDAVVELLKAGADPNLRTDEGKTACGWAVARKAPEVVELLSPYMKKVVELAQEKNLPAPTGAEKRDGWMLLSPQQIAHAETHEKLGYRLTDIFNFRARERIRIVTNLETRADQVASLSFDDITDKTQLEDARQELVRQGGSAPEQAVFTTLQKLPRPPAT